MGLFDRWEERLERAVQGTFARAAKSSVHPVEIGSTIRRAMDDRSVSASGRAIVPNVFDVELSPSDYEHLQPEFANIEQELRANAQEHSETQGYQAAGPFRIHVARGDDLDTGVFRVRPSKVANPDATGMTGMHRPVRGPAPQPSPSPQASPAPQQRAEVPSAPRARPPAAPAIVPPPPPAAAAVAAAAAAAAPPARGIPASQLQTPVPDPPRRDAPPPPPQAPAAPVVGRRPNPARRPWLDIDGERYPLMSALSIAGRDDGCDIVLNDPGVSRRHSEFRVTVDGPHTVTTIRDLGSTNGTFVNSERITSEHLRDGDRVTIGRTNITFRAGKK